jgi:hypothetical protein
MTTPRVRWLPALLVAVVLFAVASPPAAAERTRVRIPGSSSFSLWEDMRSLLSALLGALGKSGNTLDPNGRPAPGSGDAGTVPADGSPGGESGSSLDPDGAK